MTIHANFIEDTDNNLIDIQWYCSESCYTNAGHSDIGAYPCGQETDYCVFCSQCGDFIWQGISCDVESCRHSEL